MCIKVDTNKCYGCNACIAICPVNAIEVTKNRMGFYYPEINEKKCIKCGKCEQVCPIKQQTLPRSASQLIAQTPPHSANRLIDAENQQNFVQEYYAGQNKNSHILMKSSSGGIFAALAESIFELDGVVYGAGFDAEWNVHHFRAETPLEAEKFFGSKYIQSDNVQVYGLIEKDLKDERWVLFSGTPCQCEGVRKYVKQMHLNDSGLLLIDFVCHGVSSPEIWKQYIEHLSSKRGQIAEYHFRNKDRGRKNSATRIINIKGVDISANKYSFMEMYRSLLITRRSCFACEFTSFDRCSDLTLGDFWNIDQLKNNFDVNKGVSQIIISSSKGKQLFTQIADKIDYLKCTQSDCWQPHLEYPVEKPGCYTKFEQFYTENTFKDVLQKYGSGTFLGKCKRTLIPIVRKLGLYVFAGKVYNLILGKHRKNI